MLISCSDLKNELKALLYFIWKCKNLGWSNDTKQGKRGWNLFMECWVCSIIIECVNFLNNHKTSLVVLMQCRTAGVRKREIPWMFRWFEYPPNIPTQLQIKTPTVKCKHCTAHEQVPLLGYYRILYWGLLGSLNAILEVSYEILLH